MSTRHLPVFQYTAYSKAPMPVSMELARAMLDEAGAMLTDIKRFSNKQIVFQLNVRLDDWEAFRSTLARSELNVETAPERPNLNSLADEDGDLFGTFTVVMTGDEHERADIIPSVPG